MQQTMMQQNGVTLERMTDIHKRSLPGRLPMSFGDMGDNILELPNKKHRSGGSNPLLSHDSMVPSFPFERNALALPPALRYPTAPPSDQRFPVLWQSFCSPSVPALATGNSLFADRQLPNLWIGKTEKPARSMDVHSLIQRENKSGITLSAPATPNLSLKVMEAELIPKLALSPSLSESPSTSPPDSPSSSSNAKLLELVRTSNTGFFVLQEQPNKSQRKSYSYENRWMNPDPLIIRMRDVSLTDLPQKILHGTVEVKLVNDKGMDLTTKGILESEDGHLTQPFDIDLKAKFCLKFSKTSSATNWRLLFNVEYTLEGNNKKSETILSEPFVVHTNSMKKNPDPCLTGIKPSKGWHQKETEVWIKGSGFAKGVTVTFGDHVAKILEVAENIVVVAAPKRQDLIRPTKVEVRVANKNATSEQKIFFFYKVKDPSSSEQPQWSIC